MASSHFVKSPNQMGLLKLWRDIPEPSATQVRIKVQACGVCDSDSFTKEGIFPGIQYPRVPGHEIAGVIDKVGKKRSLNGKAIYSSYL